MQTSVSLRVVLTIWLLCLVPLTSEAQGVGGIGGAITDDSGAALPGVTVALVNPGVIGGEQQTDRKSTRLNSSHT